jgi:hypothetical protein
MTNEESNKVTKNSKNDSSSINQDELSVSEQIERSSVNINVFSNLDQKSMIPVNAPILLGGEDIISQKTTIEKIEEGFGQLNIMDLFSEREFILNCAQYSTFQYEHEDVLTPNIYELKARSDQTYLLNMLITPYSDLNLTKYFDEIQFMTNAYNGLTKRQLAEGKELAESSTFSISQEKASHLASYLQYLIFQERSMRTGVERVKKESFMLCAMFVKAHIEAQTEVQCFGECGKSFEREVIEEMTCECGGELLFAPPILHIDAISFSFPEQINELTNNDITPISVLDNFLSILMPRNINLAINRISPEIFSSLVTIPKKSIYYSKDFNDYVEVISDYRINEDETLMIFAAITDTRFHDPQLPSSITLSVLVRDFVEGLKKGKQREEIHSISQISNWKLTPYFKLDEIDQYQSFEGMINGKDK